MKSILMNLKSLVQIFEILENFYYYCNFRVNNLFKKLIIFRD